MPFHAGERWRGYSFAEPLGAGGQGSVWRVELLDSPGTFRALKVVEVADVGAAALQRVLREAKLLSELAHPSIVRCRTYLHDVDRHVVVVELDLVTGRSLGEALTTPGFTTPHREAVLGHLATALAHLHARGIAHRDLKPENVLIADGFWADPSRPEHVKLVDFGIAVSSDDGRALTRVGNVIGTAPFIAPERLAPEFWGAATDDRSSDVFAFGVLAWILLTNSHPAGLARDTQVVPASRAYEQIVRSGAPWPPQAPPGAWGRVAARCLTLHADARPADAVAMLALLPSGAAAPAGTAEGARPAPHTATAQVTRGATTPTSALTARDAPNAVLAPPPASTTGGTAVARPVPSPAPRRARLIGVAVGASALSLLTAAWLLWQTPRSGAVGPGARDVPAGGEAVGQAASVYRSTTCDEPCAAGGACRVTTSNSSAGDQCLRGSTTCRPCRLAEITCIPGARADRLLSGERFALRFSHVTEYAPGSATAIAGCPPSRRAAQVCFKRHADSSFSCVATDDACNAARTFPTILEVTTDDLTRTGLDIEVRDRAGRVVARREGASYSSMGRHTICSGLAFGGLQTSGVDIREVEFFLDPL